jgi:hypothetical protein
MIIPHAAAKSTETLTLHRKAFPPFRLTAEDAENAEGKGNGKARLHHRDHRGHRGKGSGQEKGQERGTKECMSSIIISILLLCALCGESFFSSPLGVLCGLCGEKAVQSASMAHEAAGITW